MKCLVVLLSCSMLSAAAATAAAAAAAAAAAVVLCSSCCRAAAQNDTTADNALPCVRSFTAAPMLCCGCDFHWNAGILDTFFVLCFCSSLDTSFQVRSRNESNDDETHTDGYVITTGCNYNWGNNRWKMSVSIERNVNKVECNVI